MGEEDHDSQPPTGPEAGGPVTPGEEPSALERGARILERLRRRSSTDPNDSKRDESRLR